MNDDKEYVERLSKMYAKVLSLKENDDYVINQPQMDKLIETIDFFSNIAKKCDGELEPVNLVPKMECGGVTASFLVFDIIGDDIEDFRKVLGYVSAFTIDATTDGKVCLSITIPKVFVPVEK